MKFYNKKGEIVGDNYPVKYYKNMKNELIKVPNSNSSYQDIKDFCLLCVHKNSGISIENIENVYENLYNTKNIIIKNLYILYRLYISINNFKSRAYYNALKNIEKINYPLTSGKQARKIKGIGESISNKIEDIIENKRLTKIPDDVSFEDFQREMKRYDTVKLFENIWGINTKTAIKLVNKGYKTLNDLLKNEDLTKTQRLGIKYYYDLKERIPREQISFLEKNLKNIFYNLYPDYNKFCICGSYRRGLSSSGDIDVMISVDDDLCSNVMENYVNTLYEENIVIDVLTIGPKKFQGICRTPDGKARRLDIACIKTEHWGTGILYFTGSAQFNKDMRSYAKSKGFRLNEDHILNIKTNEVHTFPTEEGVFDFLELGYVPPEDRNYLFF